MSIPPLLLSLAYPGAYPLEKTDELVKAVCGRGEARASSHFSVSGTEHTEAEEKKESRGEERQGRKKIIS